MARNFGWTLTDANRSTRSGLVSFRYNMLRRQYVGACTALQVPTIITTATNNSARNGDSRRGVFQDDDAYMRDPWLSSATYSPFRRQPSQGSDSCFGSEFPSLTSTGTNEESEYNKTQSDVDDDNDVYDDDSMPSRTPVKLRTMRSDFVHTTKTASVAIVTATSRDNEDLASMCSNNSSLQRSASKQSWNDEPSRSRTPVKYFLPESADIQDDLVAIPIVKTAPRESQDGAPSSQCTSSNKPSWHGVLFQDPISAPDDEEEMSLTSVYDELRQIPIFQQFPDQDHERHDYLQHPQQQHLQQQQQLSRTSSSGSSSSSSGGCEVLSKDDYRANRHASIAEDEMCDIAHRLLTRVCEVTLSRYEGECYVPLII